MNVMLKTNNPLLLIGLFLLGLAQPAQGQVSCADFPDSLRLAADTIYLQQPTDTTADLGVQWLGHTDLSYMHCWVDFSDSLNLSISGGTVTGGLASPYPNPFFFSVAVDYLRPAIPNNLSLTAYIHFIQGNLADTCSKAVVFIINPTGLSQSEAEGPAVSGQVYPQPLTKRSHLQVPPSIQGAYRLIIYNSSGATLFRTEQMDQRDYTLRRRDFTEAGVYYILLQPTSGLPQVIKLLVQ